MQRRYPDDPNQVNQHQLEMLFRRPQPSFYAIIPATVRYCKTIPPASKLLYGEITALCDQRGYCWADNAYFQELYGVDRSTVKRWLAALDKHGLIYSEVVRSTSERRLYIMDSATPTMRTVMKKRQEKHGIFDTRGAQNCHPPGAKMNPPRRKNAPHNTTSNREEFNKTSETLNVADTKKRDANSQAEAARKKVQASPEIWIDEAIRLVIELTGDDTSRARFQQLATICAENEQRTLLEDAYRATSTRLYKPGPALAKPGAYFQRILISKLNDAQIHVPCGTARQRKSIRDDIRKSLGLDR